MRFYTNVQMVGDNFLVRGYEDGKHFMTREKFYPTLFVPSKRKTKYKTLEGDYVESVDCLLYTSPSPRDDQTSRMPSSA